MTFNNIFFLLKLNLISTGNQTIYSLKQIKLLNKIIPNTIYQNKLLVVLFSILGFIKTLFKEFMFNFSIIIITILIPCFFQEVSNNFNIYLTEIPSIIFLCIILTKIFKPTENKYNAVRMLRFNPKIYTTIEIIKYLFITTIITLPFILLLQLTFSKETYLTINLISNYILTYIFINIFFLYYYSKKNIVIPDSNKYFLLLLIIFLSTFIINMFNLSITKTIFIIYNIILFIIDIIFIIWYSKTNILTKLYKEKFSSYINIIDEDHIISKNYEKRIKLNKDIKINKELYGYNKFNEIFIKRHQELLHDSVKLYTILFSIIFIITIIASIYFNPVKKVLKALIDYKYLLLILLIYFSNRGQDTTRAMFYHCDNAMLKYNFYRNKDTILKLYKLRIISLIKLNLPITLLFTIFINIIYIITSKFKLYIILLLSISTISTSIFFSIYYLSLYYLYQPYSNNMRIKNAKYTIILLITYILIYEAAMDYNINIIISTSICSITSIILSIIFIILIKNISYKTFKLRNE